MQDAPRNGVKYLRCGHWMCQGCWLQGTSGDAVAQRAVERCPLCREPTGFHALGMNVAGERAVADADSIANAPISVAEAAALIGRAAINEPIADAGEAIMVSTMPDAARLRAMTLAHRFTINRLPTIGAITPRAFGWEALPSMSGYAPGAFVNLVADGGNPHAVLHAQRRAAYMWLDSFAATAPADTIFVDVGGRPDIVETLPNPSGRWRYMCPLIMDEDHDRSRDVEPYLGTCACRCRLGASPNDPGELNAPCHICGAESRVMVFMHSAYYIPRNTLVALAQEGPVVICTHRFDAFSGQFAYRRGLSSPTVEATWTRSGDMVTMKVEGNQYTYEHSSMAWLRASSSLATAVGCARWRRVTSLGDYSVNADPMAPTHACLDIYIMERCAPEVVQVGPQFGRRVRHGVRTVTASDGTLYEFYKEGAAVQIVAQGPNGTRSLTVSYDQFEEVSRKFPGQPPQAAMLSALQRARQCCGAADIVFLCTAAQEYTREDTEALATAMVVRRPADEALSNAFRGVPHNTERVDAHWRVGSALFVLGLTGSPLTALLGLAFGSKVREFLDDVRTDGLQIACRRRGITPMMAAAVGTLLGLVVAWQARRAYEALQQMIRRAMGGQLRLALPMSGSIVQWWNAREERPRLLEDALERVSALCARARVVVATGVVPAMRHWAADIGRDVITTELCAWGQLVRSHASSGLEDIRSRAGRAIAVYGVSSSDDRWRNVAATLLGSMPNIVREVTQADIDRVVRGPEFLLSRRMVPQLPFLVSAVALAAKVPLAVCAILPFSAASVGWVAAAGVVRDVVFEEAVKQGWGALAERAGMHRIAGHIAFATAEVALKLHNGSDDLVGVGMAWAMHVGLACSPFLSRCAGHSMWNLAVTCNAALCIKQVMSPVARSGRLCAAAGERYRAVIEIGLGGFVPLAFGNHVWGQSHEGAVAPPNPTLKPGAWVKAPRPFTDLLLKPKPMMVMGPIVTPCELGVPVSYAWNEGIEQWCLEGRHCMDTPAPDPAALERFAEFSKRYNRQIYKRMQVEAVPWATWIGDFAPARRAQLERARVEYMRDPYVAMNHDVAVLDGRTKRYEATLRSFFCKVEQTVPGKTPRGIQALRDVALVPAGCWFKALPRALAGCADGRRECDGVAVVYGLSRTKSEAMRLAMQIALDGRAVVLTCGDDGWVALRGRAYSLDAKRWDAHTGRRLLEIGNATWREMGCPRTGSRLLDAGLARHGYTRAGLEYFVDGTTGSGDLDTITKNTDTDSKIMVRAAILSLRTGRPFAECLREVGLSLGIEYEFVAEEGVSVADVVALHGVEFCSALPVLLQDGTWGMCPKLGRVIYRFGLCLTGHSPECMLRAKCMSLIADAKHSTLCTLFAHCMLVRAGPGKVAPFATLRRFGCLTNSLVGPDADYESAAVVARYGFSKEVIADRIVHACTVISSRSMCVECPVLAAIIAIDV